jgi:hypothetical protein
MTGPAFVRVVLANVRLHHEYYTYGTINNEENHHRSSDDDESEKARLPIF